MLIFLYDTWSAPEIYKYLGVAAEDVRQATLAGYSLGVVSDGFVSAVKCRAQIEGIDEQSSSVEFKSEVGEPASINGEPVSAADEPASINGELAKEVAPIADNVTLETGNTTDEAESAESSTDIDVESASIDGILVDIADSIFEALQTWADNNNFIFEEHEFGIESAKVLLTTKSLDNSATKLEAYELLGVLKQDCPLGESTENALSEEKEVDLYTRYTFRDKQWWNKTRIITCSVLGCTLVGIVVLGIVQARWLWSGKHTDNLGAQVLSDVIMSEPPMSKPTEMLGFDGKPIKIELPSEIQPAEDVYELPKIDFAALREKYPSSVAWVTIPNLGIEYPVAQADDNEYYLTHDINGTYSQSGWVFADCRNTYSAPMRNFMIYAHNMKSGVMFGKLPHILNEEWYSNPDNQYIYLITDNYTAVYQIFNAMRVKSEEVIYYRRDLTEQDMVDYLNEMVGYNILDGKLTYNKPFKPSDKVITLSTCADAQGVEKFVVQGILVYSKKLDNLHAAPPVTSSSSTESTTSVESSAESITDGATSTMSSSSATE